MLASPELEKVEGENWDREKENRRRMEGNYPYRVVEKSLNYSLNYS